MLSGVVVAVALAGMLLPPGSAAAPQSPHGTPRPVIVAPSVVGQPGDILRGALAVPHVTIRVGQDSVPIALLRDTTFDRTVIVLGGSATVASHVDGDVIVVGGDLLLHPGAVVSGRTVAIGGSVINSSLARVRGGLWDFRFVHLTVRDSADVTLVERQPMPPQADTPLPLRNALYFRTPRYTRVDGLVIPWGPDIALLRQRVILTPEVTYRSDLGAFDPQVHVSASIKDGLSLEAWGGRSTFSNDEWIWPTLFNSFSVLVRGRDYRNYYRGIRYQLALQRNFVTLNGSGWLSGGVLTENAESVEAGGPWSITGDESSSGILRANPAVENGRITSIVGAVHVEPSFAASTLSATLQLESALDAPGDRHFTQGTLHSTFSLPTFRDQSLDILAHVMLTAGDTAAPQRFAYLGGLGTLPTFPILSLGGDQLFYLDATYSMDISRVQLPVVGSPKVALSYMVGSAGVGSLPSLEQNLALGVKFIFVQVQFAVNPQSGKTNLLASVALQPSR
ncbi:MAG TPA: hypothetical protein VFK13_02830 [Gemmatimonadaceae bacterium]|nr:hypothetical protein [Gemmatimonadaceae bacterium]